MSNDHFEKGKDMFSASLVLQNSYSGDKKFRYT